MKKYRNKWILTIVSDFVILSNQLNYTQLFYEQRQKEKTKLQLEKEKKKKKRRKNGKMLDGEKSKKLIDEILKKKCGAKKNIFKWMLFFFFWHFISYLHLWKIVKKNKK